jgi:hypothetical protein
MGSACARRAPVQPQQPRAPHTYALLRVPFGARDPPIEWLVAEYKAHRQFLVRRFKAVVRIVIRHLALRRQWSAYGKRLQKEPGLKAVYDKVYRRRGILYHL